jgi:hypothetical protein
MGTEVPYRNVFDIGIIYQNRVFHMGFLQSQADACLLKVGVDDKEEYIRVSGLVITSGGSGKQNKGPLERRLFFLSSPACCVRAHIAAAQFNLRLSSH